jgi:hypothetical protein
LARALDLPTTRTRSCVIKTLDGSSSSKINLDALRKRWRPHDLRLSRNSKRVLDPFYDS